MLFGDNTAELRELKPTPLLEWEGKLERLANEDYHARPEISSSDLKHIINTPLHFKRLCLEKNTLERQSNEAFALGECAHSVFLEQATDGFTAVPDGIDRRTKQGRADYEAFVAANAGKRVISADQLKRVKEMFNVIASNTRASELVSRGGVLIEESFLYRDEGTGLACKFRPDIMWLGDESIEISDYKTAESAAPHAFAKAAARYYYHLSAAHYIVGAERLYNRPVTAYKFIVQEKSEPYAVAIYTMSMSDIQRAISMRAGLIGRIAECMQTGLWPDWSSEERALSLPGYAFELKENQ
jgi:hypothetical protein